MSESGVIVLFDLSDTLVDFDYRLMPGTRELIEALHESGAVLGIVTGNRSITAMSAMRNAGLKERFSFFIGNEYSSSHDSRIKAAIHEASRKLGSIDPSKVFCVDDRPMRSETARGMGLNFIGIATGEVSYEAFNSFLNGHNVFRDLTDTKAILAAIIGKNTTQPKRKKLKA